MNATSRLEDHFQTVLAKFMSRPAGQAMQGGQIERKHYAAVMRQIFHQARENPQIQAYTTARFRGAQRDSVKGFFRHAMSEIGHDQMALNDLKALGVDVAGIPGERPAATTIALTSFAYYQVSHYNPVGYLGYLYFLEFLPTTTGQNTMEVLERSGIPTSAMSFLDEHAKVDVHHNKLMQGYIADLVKTDDDYESVAYCMSVTGALYARMIEQALEEA